MNSDLETTLERLEYKPFHFIPILGALYYTGSMTEYMCLLVEDERRKNPIHLVQEDKDLISAEYKMVPKLLAKRLFHAFPRFGVLALYNGILAGLIAWSQTS